MKAIQLYDPQIYMIMYALEAQINRWEYDLNDLSRDDCYTMNARTRKDIGDAKRLIERLKELLKA